MTEAHQGGLDFSLATLDRAERSAADATGFLIRCMDGLGVWLDRARERRQLRALDDRMLADIAGDRSVVEREAAKPFWRA